MLPPFFSDTTFPSYFLFSLLIFLKTISFLWFYYPCSFISLLSNYAGESECLNILFVPITLTMTLLLDQTSVRLL